MEWRLLQVYKNGIALAPITRSPEMLEEGILARVSPGIVIRLQKRSSQSNKEKINKKKAPGA
jgi:hypothetical protein